MVGPGRAWAWLELTGTIYAITIRIYATIYRDRTIVTFSENLADIDMLV